MRIYVSQIYIEAGVNYPFRVEFQRYIHTQLSERVTPSTLFIDKYSPDFDIIFRMSAKTGLTEPEIRGPTVFRKDKDVEYTVFLPFDHHEPKSHRAMRRILQLLFSSIDEVLVRLEIDTSQIQRDAEDLIERIVSDPKMVEIQYHSSP